jgi:hypothetical protein
MLERLKKEADAEYGVPMAQRRQNNKIEKRELSFNVSTECIL